MKHTYNGRTDTDFYVDIVMIAPPQDIAVAKETAQDAGRLIWCSAPKPVGGDDKRHRIELRLDSNIY